MPKPNHGVYEFDSAWQQLTHMAKRLSEVSLIDLFKQDVHRQPSFSLDACGIHLDFSKNHINHRVLDCLIDLANHSPLATAIEDLMTGKPVNNSQNQAAWHSALRALDHPEVLAMRQQLATLTEKIHQKKHLGASNKPIQNIVHIGIGGSFLGPKLIHHALSHLEKKDVTCHFIANIDAHQFHKVIAGLNPETTLFIVASKSFTTLETIINAQSAQRWLNNHGINDISDHFIAITENQEQALKFGIKKEHCLVLWPWVGGRFSVWSAIGLSICLEYGFDTYKQLLAGARAMDEHFRDSPFSENLPVILALITLWYHNFLNYNAHGIIPYSYPLRLLPAYIQQLDMESLGKSVDNQGNTIDYPTGSLIWGAEGTNGQHAFHQWLLQGTEHSTLDFIFARQGLSHYEQHQNWLVANCLAQSQALMYGKSESDAYHELIQQGMVEQQAQRLAKHKKTTGNKPSNTLILNSLSAQQLGSLLALYEHKIYSQSVILNINAFDQWGVELGKILSQPIAQALDQPQQLAAMNIDSSTKNLIKHYLKPTQSS